MKSTLEELFSFDEYINLLQLTKLNNQLFYEIGISKDIIQSIENTDLRKRILLGFIDAIVEFSKSSDLLEVKQNKELILKYAEFIRGIIDNSDRYIFKSAQTLFNIKSDYLTYLEKKIISVQKFEDIFDLELEVVKSIDLSEIQFRFIAVCCNITEGNLLKNLTLIKEFLKLLSLEDISKLKLYIVLLFIKVYNYRDNLLDKSILLELYEIIN